MAVCPHRAGEGPAPCRAQGRPIHLPACHLQALQGRQGIPGFEITACVSQPPALVGMAFLNFNLLDVGTTEQGHNHSQPPDQDRHILASLFPALPNSYFRKIKKITILF